MYILNLLEMCLQKKNEALCQEEWDVIGIQCKEAGHLIEDLDLRGRIAQDEQAIKETGITFEQLKKFIYKIRIHYDHAKKNDDEEKFERIKRDFREIVDYPGISGNKECCLIFGNIVVFKVSFFGAKECPFQSRENKKYYGHDYGSNNWYFLNIDTNETMCICDLLFHQISEHHFFQSPNSRYRVDPLKLVRFFNLERGVDYSTTTQTKQKWILKEITNYNDSDNYSCCFLSSFISSFISRFMSMFTETEYASMKEVQQGGNIIYYNSDKAVLIKNSGTKFPEHINGFEYQRTCDESVSGFYLGSCIIPTPEEINKFNNKKLLVSL